MDGAIFVFHGGVDLKVQFFRVLNLKEALVTYYLVLEVFVLRKEIKLTFFQISVGLKF